MKIVRQIERVQNSAITIGTFDGLHLGHQRLIKKLMRLGKNTVIITFDEIPKNILGSKVEKIMDINTKIQILENFGIDRLYILTFNKKLSNLKAKEFLDKIIDTSNHFVTGEYFRLGSDRKGISFLKNYFGSNISICNPYMVSGKRISSTLIREKIKNGEILGAKELLGRFYKIKGQVVPGNGIGRRIGFPTANILEIDTILPKNGVYVSYTDVNGKLYKSLTNIGYAPTFKDREFKVECHLLDFSNDIYEQNIKIFLIDRLRDEVKFNSLDNLVKEINNDIKISKDIFTKFGGKNVYY